MEPFKFVNTETGETWRFEMSSGPSGTSCWITKDNSPAIGLSYGTSKNSFSISERELWYVHADGPAILSHT